MQSLTGEQNQMLDLIRDEALTSDHVGDGSLCSLKDGELRDDELCFYKVRRLTFEEDYPHREAFENVLQTQDNEAFNFVYILDGDERGIELYLGVVRNHNPNRAELGKMFKAVDRGKILSSVFEGNFGGSVLERLKGAELDEIMFDVPKKFRNAGVIVGVPSLDEIDGLSRDRSAHQQHARTSMAFGGGMRAGIRSRACRRSRQHLSRLR